MRIKTDKRRCLAISVCFSLRPKVQNFQSSYFICVFISDSSKKNWSWLDAVTSTFSSRILNFWLDENLWLALPGSLTRSLQNTFSIQFFTLYYFHLRNIVIQREINLGPPWSLPWFNDKKFTKGLFDTISYTRQFSFEIVFK